MAETAAGPLGAGAAGSVCQGISPWLFLLPALVFFVGYQVYPIVRVVWISFTDYQFLTNEPAQLGRLRQLCATLCAIR